MGIWGSAMRNLRALLPLHVRVHLHPKGTSDACPHPDNPTCHTVKQVSIRLDESEERLRVVEVQVQNLRHTAPPQLPGDTE